MKRKPPLGAQANDVPPPAVRDVLPDEFVAPREARTVLELDRRGRVVEGYDAQFGGEGGEGCEEEVRVRVWGWSLLSVGGVCKIEGRGNGIPISCIEVSAWVSGVGVRLNCAEWE